MRGKGPLALLADASCYPRICAGNRDAASCWSSHELGAWPSNQAFDAWTRKGACHNYCADVEDGRSMSGASCALLRAIEQGTAMDVLRIGPAHLMTALDTNGISISHLFAPP